MRAEGEHEHGRNAGRPQTESQVAGAGFQADFPGGGACGPQDDFVVASCRAGTRENGNLFTVAGVVGAVSSFRVHGLSAGPVLPLTIHGRAMVSRAFNGAPRTLRYGRRAGARPRNPSMAE